MCRCTTADRGKLARTRLPIRLATRQLPFATRSERAYGFNTILPPASKSESRSPGRLEGYLPQA